MSPLSQTPCPERLFALAILSTLQPRHSRSHCTRPCSPLSLLTFARHDYAATIPQLLSLLASCQSAPPPSPALDPFSQLSSHCGLVPTEPYATIATNLSLSYLYTCQLPAAIKTLEDAFVRAPAFVTNAMVFNLCTLYDLAFDNAVSGRKKRVMEEVVKRWGLEVKKESFRI